VSMSGVWCKRGAGRRVNGPVRTESGVGATIPLFRWPIRAWSPSHDEARVVGDLAEHLQRTI
jgi:hypothetical protein